MKQKYIWIIVVLAVFIGIGAYLAFAGLDTDTELTVEEEEELQLDDDTDPNVTFDEESLVDESDETAQVFVKEKKAAHWESNTPLHEDILPAVPVNVVIDVNFDLAIPSEISIMRDGKEYGTGTTSIDANKLALRRTMDQTAPDGRYTVNYNACWPDASCHQGTFQFEIDRTIVDSYEDLRTNAAVTITLADLSIEPAFLHIDKGTTVVWQNDDEVAHYVNTDGHPSHTYYPAQNSTELLTGDSFRLTFNEPGYYPYHCSAHADDMQGVIVVD